ncbi:MAG: methyltransferase domain-containing protein, partial [Bryobacteraceae bacterium]
MQHIDSPAPEHFPTDEISLSGLCGSGVADTKAPPPKLVTTPPGTATGPLSIPEEPGRSRAGQVNRFKLRFTGHSSREDFDRRCQSLPWWYHSYYFDNGFTIRGDYDMAADVTDYGFPQSMSGMNVLDVGTGAGWFSFYFEQLGAEVTTVDARGYSDFDVYGRFNYPPIEEEKPAPDQVDADGAPLYFSPVSRGFWLMKELLGSNVQYKNARAYDIHPDLFDGKKFDLVFLGSILCHLRDPIGALMAARSVCKHRVIAATTVVLGEPASDT